MSGQIILGIDPGLSGALAFYEYLPVFDEHKFEIFDMPTFEITRNKSKKQEIDPYGLARLINLRGMSVKTAFIEEVGATPQMGVTSAFSFGGSFKSVVQAVASAYIPMTLVRPEKWKKTMGLSADKDACRRAADKLFPKSSSLWQRAMDDGRAEAALIAYWGFKHGNA